LAGAECRQGLAARQCCGFPPAVDAVSGCFRLGALGALAVSSLLSVVPHVPQRIRREKLDFAGGGAYFLQP